MLPIRNLFVVTVLLLSLAVSRSFAKSTTPIVFIPGFAGSYLCEKAGAKSRVWPGNMDPRRIRLPMDVNLATDNLELEACGVVREPIRLGTFRVSDVYGSFVDHINRGITSGDKGIEFFYDWRLSVEHNANRLRSQLDQELPGREVDIVAHSFGGLIARYFIQNLGGENRVRQLITMGTPHRGSVDTFRTLFDGWGGSENLKDSAINWWMGGTSELRKSLLSFPGFYDLLPNSPNCCWFSTNMQFDPFELQSWEKFGFKKEVFTGPRETAFLAAELQRAYKLHRDTLSSDLPGHHRDGQRFIVTGLLDTVTRVIIDAQTGERLRYVRNQGDGTVPLYSASDGRKTSDHSLAYSPAEHMRIFNEKSALETIARTLFAGIAPTGGSETDFSITTSDKRSFVLQSLGFEVSPGLVVPGGPVRLTVRFRGNTEFSTADISNLSAKSSTIDGETELIFKLQPDLEAQTGIKIYATDFLAPKAAGTYKVRFEVPGLPEAYEDVFLVVGD